MKHLSLILSLFVVVNARDPTIVDELLAGQSELSLGHEFMERLLHDNRMMLSSYLLDLENAAINSFMDSYTVVANIADATTKAMDEFESSFCKDRIRARWNLQVTRYGNRLSECLAVTTRQMQDWNVQLNNYHETGQVTSNQVQNQGMFAITELNEFDRMHPFQELFNRRFRLILARAVRKYLDSL